MKNQILLVLLALSSLSVVACGRKAGGMDLDPELTPYVYEFLGESAAHGVDVDTSDLSVKFVPATSFEAAKIGNCHTEERADILKNGDLRRFKIKEVTVNQDTASFMKKTKSEEKYKQYVRELVFHELGHCLLGRSHDDKMAQDTNGRMQYASLMTTRNQTEVNYNFVKANWNDLVSELFANR